MTPFFSVAETQWNGFYDRIRKEHWADGTKFSGNYAGSSAFSSERYPKMLFLYIYIFTRETVFLGTYRDIYIYMQKYVEYIYIYIPVNAIQHISRDILGTLGKNNKHHRMKSQILKCQPWVAYFETKRVFGVGDHSELLDVEFASLEHSRKFHK